MAIADFYVPPFELPPRPARPARKAGLKPLPMSLEIHSPTDPMRAVVESYIRKLYQKRFGARLKEWFPTLVSLQSHGEIIAAAGYRDGGHPLFLEHYLAVPVQHYLSDDGAPVARSLIVEAGQFVAVRPGAGRLLVPLLARHLREVGYEWAVSTLTIELHHLFARMGLEHQPIAVASADRLDDGERRNWGNYYTHAPHVFFASLGAILSRFPEDEE